MAMSEKNSRWLSFLLTFVLVMGIFMFTPQTASAADAASVDISGKTIDAVKTEIQGAIDAVSSGGAVSVVGSLSGVNSGLSLNIPDGVTVNWSASLDAKAANTSLVEIYGSGSLIISEGILTISGSGSVIKSRESSKVVVKGGRLNALGNQSSVFHPIENSKVEVTGGILNADGITSFVIYSQQSDLPGNLSTVSVTGGTVITNPGVLIDGSRESDPNITFGSGVVYISDGQKSGLHQVSYTLNVEPSDLSSTIRVKYNGAELPPIYAETAGSYYVSPGKELVLTAEVADAEKYYFLWSNGMVGSTIVIPAVNSELDLKCTATKITSIKGKGFLFENIHDRQYTGKQIKLKPRIRYKLKILTEGTDYKLSYKNNSKIGKSSITVKGIGKFKDTKTFTFKIIPKKTSVTKLTAGKNQLKVTWKKVDSITKYEIRYLQTGKKLQWVTKTVPAASQSIVLNKLKSGVGYNIEVRAYKTASKGKYYSEWSVTKFSKKITSGLDCGS
jgi:hypothetical protein